MLTDRRTTTQTTGLHNDFADSCWQKIVIASTNQFGGLDKVRSVEKFEIDAIAALHVYGSTSAELHHSFVEPFSDCAASES